MVVLLLPLIQEGLLSELQAKVYGQTKVESSLPRKKCAWLGELTIAVDWDVKPKKKKLNLKKKSAESKRHAKFPRMLRINLHVLFPNFNRDHLNFWHG